ncbi:MAG: NAD-dependent epimerase/dehydratase family protein [Kiritimatiellia bacterium]
MKILVTGSAGFIGFHVAARLLAEGHEVVGLDNFNDYYPVALKRARAARLGRYAGYTGIECDLADFKVLDRLFQKHRFKAACHLAAQVGVRYSLENPFVYQKSNNEGFLNVLESARRTGLARLVYASSSSVYGGNRKMPFSESDRVDNPISLYAATKKFDELAAHAYSHLYALQTIGLRLFTVYGPWGRPDMAVWLFTEAISKGKPIKVFNRGNMRRDFTYVDDVVSGIRAALFRKNLPRCDVFNIGNHRSEKLMDLINMIADCLGKKAVMELLPLQPGDVPDTYADIRKARRALGFEPATDLAEGIPRFIAWYREYTRGGKGISRPA